MTRTILTIVTALLGAATFFASAAEACISCEYVPEVVRAKTYEAKTYERKRVYIASKTLVARPIKAGVPKNVTLPKTVQTAKAVETQPETKSKTSAKTTLADAEATPAPAEGTKVVADLGCKKFFATVGQTLTVPCE